MISTLAKFSRVDAEHLCQRTVELGLECHPVVKVARGKLYAEQFDEKAVADLEIRDVHVNRYLQQRANLDWRGELAKVQARHGAWKREGSPPLPLPPAALATPRGWREGQRRLSALHNTFGTDDVHLALLLDALGIQRQSEALRQLWSMLRSMGYPLNVNHYTSYAEGLAYQADLPALLTLLLEEIARAGVVPNVKLFRNTLGALYNGGGGSEARREMARVLVAEVLRPRYPELLDAVMEKLRLPTHVKAVYFGWPLSKADVKADANAAKDAAKADANAAKDAARADAKARDKAT